MSWGRGGETGSNLYLKILLEKQTNKKNKKMKNKIKALLKKGPKGVFSSKLFVYMNTYLDQKESSFYLLKRQSY